MSAVGNVVSLKLMIDFPDVVERINAALPEQVLPPVLILRRLLQHQSATVHNVTVAARSHWLHAVVGSR